MGVYNVSCRGSNMMHPVVLINEDSFVSRIFQYCLPKNYGRRIEEISRLFALISIRSNFLIRCVVLIPAILYLFQIIFPKNVTQLSVVIYNFT